MSYQGYENPEAVAKRRLMAEAIMGNALRAPKDIGEGLNSIGQALLYRKMMGDINKAEKTGREGAAKVFSSLFGGDFPAAPETVSETVEIDMPSARVAQAHGDMSPFRDAIAGIESGGRYDAVGPTHPKMGRALGKYQVMEANVGPWSEKHLGRRVTADEFLANPELQDAIFDAEFGSYVNKFGPEGAAQAWFAGPGGVGKTDRKDVLGTDVGSYGRKFMQALGSDAAPQQRVAQAMTGGNPDLPMAGANPQRQGPGMNQLIEAMGNPWLSDGQRSVVNALLQKEIQGQDPMRALELERAQLELDQLRNPPAEFGFIELPDGTVIRTDPRTGEAAEAFRGQPKKPESPSEVREYEYYADQERAQGREPAPYNDWRLQGKRAGATSVTVGNEPHDGALRKKLDEKTGETWSEMAELGATSAAMAQDMQVLDELIKVAPQGPITGRLAETFPGFSSAGDAFQAIVKRIAPTLRAPGSGATSDIEYEGMLKSLPALRNKPEANVAIAQIIKNKAAINIERAEIVDAYGRGEISAGDARQMMAELNKRSIVTPELAQALQGVGAQPTMQEAIPEGIDPSDWEFMTPEERALFQ